MRCPLYENEMKLVCNGTMWVHHPGTRAGCQVLRNTLEKDPIRPWLTKEEK